MPHEHTSLSSRKTALRTTVLTHLKAVAPAAQKRAGTTIARHLAPLLSSESDPADSALRPIALFASLPHEVSTDPIDALLRSRNQVRLAPRIDGGDLVFHVVPNSLALAQMPIGEFHVPTPKREWPTIALCDAALVLVPGVAFDETGRRMGYGRGYYDRALSQLDPSNYIGLLLDEQLVQIVPTGPQDVPLERLCTPSRGLFSPRRPA